MADRFAGDLTLSTTGFDATDGILVIEGAELRRIAVDANSPLIGEQFTSAEKTKLGDALTSVSVDSALFTGDGAGTQISLHSDVVTDINRALKTVSGRVSGTTLILTLTDNNDRDSTVQITGLPSGGGATNPDAFQSVAIDDSTGVITFTQQDASTETLTLALPASSVAITDVGQSDSTSDVQTQLSEAIIGVASVSQTDGDYRIIFTRVKGSQATADVPIGDTFTGAELTGSTLRFTRKSGQSPVEITLPSGSGGGTPAGYDSVLTGAPTASPSSDGSSYSIVFTDVGGERHSVSIPAVTTLQGLGNVSITGSQTGWVLTQQSDGSFAMQAPATLALNDLSNVDVAGASNGQILTLQNGSWIAANPTSGGGGVTLTQVNNAIDAAIPEARRVPAFSAADNGEFLGVRNGALEFIPQNLTSFSAASTEEDDANITFTRLDGNSVSLDITNPVNEVMRSAVIGASLSGTTLTLTRLGLPAITITLPSGGGTGGLNQAQVDARVEAVAGAAFRAVSRGTEADNRNSIFFANVAGTPNVEFDMGPIVSGILEQDIPTVRRVPEFTVADAGDVLQVNSAGDALEFGPPGAGDHPIINTRNPTRAQLAAAAAASISGNTGFWLVADTQASGDNDNVLGVNIRAGNDTNWQVRAANGSTLQQFPAGRPNAVALNSVRLEGGTLIRIVSETDLLIVSTPNIYGFIRVPVPGTGAANRRLTADADGNLRWEV